ncbi:MAG: bifunctional methylenetetrahydrofolate dehydrogenase/methenyltetrahydrofolate cyclohydrolase FolD [Candidatus Micrarchaeota archaeon]
MSATLIDGKGVSGKVLEEVASEIKSSGLKPKLAIVMVGVDDASGVYVRLKEKACQRVGVVSTNHLLPESTSEEELLALVKRLNDGPDHGILVQLPLPTHIDADCVLNAIDPTKDVDGLHPLNLGKMLSGRDCLFPCTPRGIIRLLDEYGIGIEGKEAVVVGRSNIVGKPIAVLLTKRNATVTMCHSKTMGLGNHTKSAEILVVAIGKARMITVDMVCEGAVVIDVGINRIDGKLVGDVDFEKVKEKASYITPVPRGVGPMTVAMLMKNTLEACKNQ